MRALSRRMGQKPSDFFLNASTAPDLRRADLSGLDLRGADLTAGHLDEAILSSTNLSFASLVDARAARAGFWRSNLTGAK